jgi:hypothetical protein
MSISVLLRRIAIAVSAVATILVALVIWAYASPPAYEVEHVVMSSRTRIKMQFTPSHPYLAEYNRSVVVTWANGRESRAELFPDTGGYKRSQLYQDPNGTLFVKGYFDLALVDPAASSILIKSSPMPEAAKYIGAFDYVRNVGFQFLPPPASAEEPLVPGDS